MALSISEKIVNIAHAGILEGSAILIPGGVITVETSNLLTAVLTLSSIFVAGASAVILMLDEHIQSIEKSNS